MDSPLQAVGSVNTDVGGQRHPAFMVCHAQVWIGTPTVQLVCAAMRLYNYLTEVNSYTMRSYMLTRN
jgi:hypothetical protein